MKIIRVTIENYRQYFGKLTIDFSTSDKNITIIQGDNGGGKSNFMNAIVWCLFDDEMFKSKNNEGRPIINESAMASIDTNETVTASVSVEIGEYNKAEFEFIRAVTYVKSASGRTDVYNKEFKGYQIKTTGHSKIGDPDWEIRKHFIPKDLRGFFFFDGEKMDQYFEDTSSVKKNVERISQIDILNNVISSINSTIRSIGKDMGKLSPGDERIIDELEKLQDDRIKSNDERDRLKTEIEGYEDEVRKIDKYLEDNSSALVKEKSKRRAALNESSKSISDDLKSLKDEMRSLISDSVPAVFAHSALKNAAQLIEEETNKGTLPPNVKDVFLRELLEKGTCICGRSLDDESCRANIQSLMDRIVPSDIASDATQGKFTILSILSGVDFRPKFKSIMKKQMELEELLNANHEELSAISEELAQYDEFDIADKEEKRRNLQNQISKDNRRVGYFDSDIQTIDSKIRDLNELLSHSAKDTQRYQYLNKQKEYARQLLEEFESIKRKIITEVKDRLESKTREYFFQMIWKRNAFSDVRIIDLGDKYKISVLSPEGAECLGDLSAGERQVLALSFTAALYSVSGYLVPVIIDTPLGRISGTTRDNIASALPNYLSETQLIMTMTDTEYTDSVRNAMKTAVGKEYKIQYNENSKTSTVVNI